jgi:hypothetical protein
MDVVRLTMTLLGQSVEEAGSAAAYPIYSEPRAVDRRSARASDGVWSEPVQPCFRCSIATGAAPLELHTYINDQFGVVAADAHLTPDAGRLLGVATSVGCGTDQAAKRSAAIPSIFTTRPN